MKTDTLRDVEIFDSDGCVSEIRQVFSQLSRAAVVHIFSPFTSFEGVRNFFKMREVIEALERGVTVRIVICPPDESVRDFLQKYKGKVEVYVRENFHEKLITIDDVDKKYTYIGSFNLLSNRLGSDLMVRMSEAKSSSPDEQLLWRALYRVGLPKDSERIL
jgi:hypothetical protein